MATQLDIVNLALQRLGQGAIASMDEGSPESKVALRFWDADRRAALRDFPWSFAMSSPTVLTLLDETILDYQFVYQLPTNCLRALSLYDAQHLMDFPAGDIHLQDVAQQTLTELMLFEIRQGRKLVTNLCNAALKYIVDITDPTKFDDQFVEALSYRLAVDFALPVTGNEKFANSMASLYRSSLLAARTTDAREGKRKLKVGRSFLQSRH